MQVDLISTDSILTGKDDRNVEPKQETTLQRRLTHSPLVTVELTEEELDLVESKFLKECLICNGAKPPRAHHCRKCGRCVMRMDHHCPWVGNCVGLKNLKFFLLFCLYTFVVCLIVSIEFAKEIIYC